MKNIYIYIYIYIYIAEFQESLKLFKKTYIVNDLKGIDDYKKRHTPWHLLSLRCGIQACHIYTLPTPNPVNRRIVWQDTDSSWYSNRCLWTFTVFKWKFTIITKGTVLVSWRNTSEGQLIFLFDRGEDVTGLKLCFVRTVWPCCTFTLHLAR
jgi:hypothetical protein